MKMLIHYLSVGTTTLNGGVILIILLFSVGINMFARSRTSCEHRCCSPAKDFSYSLGLGSFYLRQPTRINLVWIHSSGYLRARRMLIQV